MGGRGAVGGEGEREWKREVGVVFWESMVLEFEQLCVTGSFHVAKSTSRLFIQPLSYFPLVLLHFE